VNRATVSSERNLAHGRRRRLIKSDGLKIRKSTDTFFMKKKLSREGKCLFGAKL